MSAKEPKDTRILVVDDEPDFRTALAFTFKKMGYQVVTASNGREAYNMISENPVDVVISDIQMPDGNGVELLDRTRAERPETPIILLVTGFADLSTEEAHNKGAEALFSKPLDRKSLQETITRLLTPPEERWARIGNDRADVALKVELRFQGFDKSVEANVVSLGRGGMFVKLPTHQHPNINDAIAFRIYFESNPVPLEGSGVIRWARVKETPEFPAGCGVEFTFITDPGKQQVIDYINTRKPKAFIPNK